MLFSILCLVLITANGAGYNACGSFWEFGDEVYFYSASPPGLLQVTSVGEYQMYQWVRVDGELSFCEPEWDDAIGCIEISSTQDCGSVDLGCGVITNIGEFCAEWESEDHGRVDIVGSIDGAAVGDTLRVHGTLVQGGDPICLTGAAFASDVDFFEPCKVTPITGISWGTLKARYRQTRGPRPSGHTSDQNRSQIP